MNRRVRPFLKWAGGKFSLSEHIIAGLPNGKTLVEPFVGSGAIFLNSNYQRYILNDINADLISAFDQSGWIWRSSAAAPVTWGAAIDVPETWPKPRCRASPEPTPYP